MRTDRMSASLTGTSARAAMEVGTPLTIVAFVAATILQ
jgi:hypothetical protein